MVSIKNIVGTMIFGLCLVSLAGAQEPTFELKYSEEEAKLYRMPIKQITPKDGIRTGHVIAYGHYIKPPYKIEVKDTIILINNVQVYLALKTPGMIEKEKKDKQAEEARKSEMRAYIKAHQEEYDEMRRIDSLGKTLYEKEEAIKGKESAVRAVADFYKKQNGVDSVRAISANDGEVLVCYSACVIQYELQRIQGYKRPSHRFVRFEPYGKLGSVPDIYKTREERDKAMREMGFPTTKQGWAELWATRFEEKLTEKLVLTFWSDLKYGCGFSRESAIFTTVQVLKAGDTSQPEKYVALKGYFSHVGILTLLTNYDPREWVCLRSQR